MRMDQEDGKEAYMRHTYMRSTWPHIIVRHLKKQEESSGGDIAVATLASTISVDVLLLPT